MKEYVVSWGKWILAGLLLAGVGALMMTGAGRKRGTRLYGWRIALWGLAITLMGSAPYFIAEAKAAEKVWQGDADLETEMDELGQPRPKCYKPAPPPKPRPMCYKPKPPPKDPPPDENEESAEEDPPPPIKTCYAPMPTCYEPMPTCYEPIPDPPPPPPPDDPQPTCYAPMPDPPPPPPPPSCYSQVPPDPKPSCYAPIEDPPPPPPPPKCYAPPPRD